MWADVDQPLEKYNRWKVLFRLILGIPVMFMLYLMPYFSLLGATVATLIVRTRSRELFLLTTIVLCVLAGWALGLAAVLACAPGEVVFTGGGTEADNLAVLGAGNFELVLSHGSLLFKSPADGRGALRRAIGTESVIVSEAFANKYGVGPGDTLKVHVRVVEGLPTPAGERPFAVVAVYYDYAVDRGVVVMDRGTFRRHFGDLPPTGIAAYLRPGAEPERVRAEILERLDEAHRAFIYTNRDLRAEVLRVFDSTFSITYALEIVAIVVAMLGVAATLLTLVLERQRELSMLRLIGAARRQVQRVVVIEAALIGAASQTVGLVVGLALSMLLVYVINVQSFGWTIQFRLPAAFLAQVSVAVVVATAVAGLYPARRAARLVVERDE